MFYSELMIAFVAVYGFGGFVADAVVPATARQHLHNPAWPPHAKFHNGQTMLLGIVNGLIALVLLFGPLPHTTGSFLIASVAGSAYWVTAALAPLFPGTAWFDPEFAQASSRPLGLSPQQLLTYALCLITAVAVGLRILS